MCVHVCVCFALKEGGERAGKDRGEGELLRGLLCGYKGVIEQSLWRKGNLNLLKGPFSLCFPLSPGQNPLGYTYRCSQGNIFSSDACICNKL